mmetsp:Transcript_15612/g.22231  ORF Transcript_15612/g.22231 Transcript_15612/m.22231 type:complete len:220 (+) Transcript_15612:281-940(+)
MEYHRCANCYVLNTLAKRVSDTVEFFPHQIPFPQVSQDDFLCQSINDSVTLLKDPPPTTVPSLTAGNNTTAALQHLSQSCHCHIELQKQKQKDHVQVLRVEPIKPLPTQAPILYNPPQKVSVQTIHKKTIHVIPSYSQTFKNTAANHIFMQDMTQKVLSQPQLYHILYNDNTGKRETLETLLQGKDKAIWHKASSNEFGRLAQGNIFEVKSTKIYRFYF